MLCGGDATRSERYNINWCVGQTDRAIWGGTEDGDALLLYQSNAVRGSTLRKPEKIRRLL